MSGMGTDDSRARILTAFGLTEDDLDAYEAITGHQAARERANREYEEFRAMIIERAKRLAATLN